MPVTVNTGEILTTNNDIIRTRGCDPCVALIVVYQAHRTCAHFAVTFQPPYTQNNIDAQLNPILAANFPLQNIVSVGYTWGGVTPGMGSALICNRLAAYFANFAPQVGVNQDSITTDNANQIVFMNLQGWPFTNNPAINMLADL